MPCCNFVSVILAVAPDPPSAAYNAKATAPISEGRCVKRSSAQAPVKVGEINSYKVIPAFLEPYRKGWELAVEEINKGGMKVYPADIDSVIERMLADPRRIVQIGIQDFANSAAYAQRDGEAKEEDDWRLPATWEKATPKCERS